MKNYILLLCLLFLLTGCAPAPAEAAEQTAAVTEIPAAETAMPTEAPTEAPAPPPTEAPAIPTGVVLEPEAPGEAETRCEVAVVVCPCEFTRAAKELAASTGVLLWDEKKLSRLMKISGRRPKHQV